MLTQISHISLKKIAPLKVKVALPVGEDNVQVTSRLSVTQDWSSEVRFPPRKCEKSKLKRWMLFFSCIIFLASCSRVSRSLEPVIESPRHPKDLYREHRQPLFLPENFSLSPFYPLTLQEQCTDWGKEYQIALAFANDFDLYRAITGFKRALFLLPIDLYERRLEIEYAIVLAYYLGKKYVEVVHNVESANLAHVDGNFPAFRDLLLILYESYRSLGYDHLAENILDLLEQIEPQNAHKLSLLSALQQANFEMLGRLEHQDLDVPEIKMLLANYHKESKSIRKAEILNAVCPGAGYWYVGLKETAVTAFLVNGLFMTAGVYFIKNGNPAAGAIFLSLEGGWYFGGIIGGGYAAKYYNENLYCKYVERLTQEETYFPLFMLNYTF